MSRVQREVKAPFPVRACACKAQPRFYMTSMIPIPTTRYFGECSPCELRTPQCASLTEAAKAWGAKNALVLAPPQWRAKDSR